MLEYSFVVLVSSYCTWYGTRFYIYSVCVRVSLSFSLSLILSLSLCLPLCVSVFMRCVTLRVRIANLLVTGSCCRGGIVNIRFGCSSALLERRRRPKALWRFRVSTSNSLSGGRTRLHAHTPTRHIDHTYAQQGIRVCGDDHFQPPKLSDLFSRVF